MPLGLSRIYVQAKRYGADNIVGRPAIQGFVGALARQSGTSGVFITTSRFSADARAYADSVTARVVLVDGDRLTRLMIKYGVGVQVKDTIKIVEVDGTSSTCDSRDPVAFRGTHRGHIDDKLSRRSHPGSRSRPDSRSRTPSRSTIRLRKL